MAVTDKFGLYMGQPTRNRRDGIAVSQGTELTPVTVGWLNGAWHQTSKPILIAARCSDGLISEPDLLCWPVGATRTQWRFADYEGGQVGAWGDWGAAFALGEVGDGNRLFWAQARATLEDYFAGTRVDITVDWRVTGVLYDRDA